MTAESCFSVTPDPIVSRKGEGLTRNLREHLQGVIELKTISDKYFDGTARKIRENLSSRDEAIILQAANRADEHFQRYLALLSKQVRDRGEEGMLVTYYWGPVVFCNNIRATYSKHGKLLKQNEEGDTVPQPYSLKDEKSLGH